MWTKTLRVKGNLGRDHGFIGKPREVSIRCKKLVAAYVPRHTQKKGVDVAAHASEAGANGTQELQERA